MKQFIPGQVVDLSFDLTQHRKYPKIHRAENINCILSEKLDGTNGVIYIGEDRKTIKAGSRNQWITSQKDNFGFAKFVYDNRQDLLKMGPGYHYGEWVGPGINRNYDLQERKFYLFPSGKIEARPECCHSIPIEATCTFESLFVVTDFIRQDLVERGSFLNPAYQAEGIVIYLRELGKHIKIIF